MKTKITKLLQKSRAASMSGAVGAAINMIDEAEILMKDAKPEHLDALGFKLRRAKAFVMTALGEPGKGYDTYMS